MSDLPSTPAIIDSCCAILYMVKDLPIYHLYGSTGVKATVLALMMQGASYGKATLRRRVLRIWARC